MTARPPAEVRRDIEVARAAAADQVSAVHRLQAELAELERQQLAGLAGEEDTQTVAAWFAERLVGPLVEALAPRIAEELRQHPPIERLAYSVPEVVEALGISKDTVYALIRSESLRAVTTGGRTLVPADAIRDFLAGRAPAPDQDAHQDALPGLVEATPSRGRSRTGRGVDRRSAS